MARHNNDWDRNRENQRDRQRDRDQEYRVSREGHGHRSSEYGSHAGWGGQGFSQGSFGRYGSQGERMYNQYGGQGWGAQSGYNAGYGPGGRDIGGGMGTYTASPDINEHWNEQHRDERERAYDQDRYNERFNNRINDREYDRERQQYGRDWRGESQGWSSQGSRGPTSENWRPADPWDPSNTPAGGQYPGSPYGSSGFGGPGSYGNTGSSNMGYGGNQGRHAGRGPKSYQRSDERIREDVNEHLTRHPDVDATEIDVEVQNGEVTLRGTVDHRYSKRIAEDVAEQVFGVRQVHNQLRVSEQQDRGTFSNTPASGSTATSGSQRELAGSRK